MRFRLARKLPAILALCAGIPAPAARAQLTLTPATQTIVAPGQGSLTLTLPAPSMARTTVEVIFSNSAMLVTDFWIDPGETSATNPVHTGVGGGGDATITARFGGAQASAVVHVLSPAPVITRVFPETFAIGHQPFLQVFDESFPSGPRTIFLNSIVEWNGQPLETTLVQGDTGLPTFLMATLPPDSTLQPGTATITVVNPPPGGGTSASFTVQITGGANTVPALSAKTAAILIVALAATGLVVLRRV